MTFSGDFTGTNAFPSPESCDAPDGCDSPQEIIVAGDSEAQPKTAAKRKRENRYKNAPPSVLSVCTPVHQPVTYHRTHFPVNPAHQSRASGSGMALHAGRCAMPLSLSLVSSTSKAAQDFPPAPPFPAPGFLPLQPYTTGAQNTYTKKRHPKERKPLTLAL